MQLHTLQPNHRGRPKKRIGRGGKRGTYSGRGIKGQRARSGHRIRPALRDTIQRLPKLRGVKFRRFRERPALIKLDQLSGRMKGNDITVATLREAGFALHPKQRAVKIVGNGNPASPFVVRGISVSRSVREKILKAGGTVGGNR